MAFPDHSFDFIWTWGVIHHSSDTRAVLREMWRVLRPGGRVTLMVYYRGLWSYYFVGGLIKGLLLGPDRRNWSFSTANQRAVDGALARYYRADDWAHLCRGLFAIEQWQVMGNKADVLILPPSPLKRFLLEQVPDKLSRFATNHLRCGSFLVVKMKRL
jgi:SAM-dependent methyltransferase